MSPSSSKRKSDVSSSVSSADRLERQVKVVSSDTDSRNGHGRAGKKAESSASAQVESYERKKRYQAARNADEVRAAQDIGEIPPVKDQLRKDRARESFRIFCETYRPETFSLGWSQDHLKVIDRIESAVFDGSLFCMVMPRGTGKTSLSVTAVEWASLYGHSPFTVLFASSADRAKSLLEGIKIVLETSKYIAEDFPEVIYPIQRLERIVARANGQKYRGQHTRISWSADRIVLPSIEGSDSSGVVISTSGMRGAELRGQQAISPLTGETIRPSLAFGDDPQTTESALSPSQTRKRLLAVQSDVLGMAGPNKKIAGLIAATIIAPNDLPSQLLDREKNPEWRGEHMKLVYSFPKAEKLWDEYAEIRAASLRNDSDGHEATEFYAEHRSEMDDGAVVAWPERYNSDEISAIQHAMNLRYRDYESFMAEYQNEPLIVEYGNRQLTDEEITQKTNGIKRGIVPDRAVYCTVFIDVMQDALYWMIVSWEQDFTGYVTDYGTFPEQYRSYYTLRDLRRTLPKTYPDAGPEGAVYSGLNDLVSRMMETPLRRECGAASSIDKIFIDSAWGQSTDTVYKFASQSKYAATVMPYRGVFIGGSGIPFSEGTRNRGDRVGHHWKIPRPTYDRPKLIFSDVNYWKSFVHSRMSVPYGDVASMSLFGKDPNVHQMLAEHMTAEYSIPVEGRGRTVDEWKIKAKHLDNHFFDCMTGCACAASVCGAELKAHSKPCQSDKPVSFAELQRRQVEDDAKRPYQDTNKPVSFAELQRKRRGE